MHQRKGYCPTSKNEVVRVQASIIIDLKHSSEKKTMMIVNILQPISFFFLPMSCQVEERRIEMSFIL